MKQSPPCSFCSLEMGSYTELEQQLAPNLLGCRFVASFLRMFDVSEVSIVGQEQMARDHELMINLGY